MKRAQVNDKKEIQDNIKEYMLYNNKKDIKPMSLFKYNLKNELIWWWDKSNNNFSLSVIIYYDSKRNINELMNEINIKTNKNNYELICFENNNIKFKNFLKKNINNIEKCVKVFHKNIIDGYKYNYKNFISNSNNKCIIINS